ncbi:MAG: Trk system potassium transporter TrkA, partial [Christensenellaceae bacterium]|nr:Trk system potassium transporter TrkA [Christensenellaceae bacterium]
MKIIIVGDGKVGFALSESLSKEGHDITIIDNRTDVLKKSVESLDVIAIRGNGASSAVQKQAGVADADLLIAATSMDEVNMICCLVAKKLGARHTIARIRNPEYNEQLKMMQQEMGLSMVVNPELAAATEIARLISFPSALNIGTFAKGKVSMIEFKVSEDSPLVNRPLPTLQGHFASRIIISAVTRGAELFIPKGNFVIEAGDNVYITGTPRNIIGFLHSLGTNDKKIKSVFIVGGGLITFYLARLLVDSGISVTIIEKNPERCNMLCEKIPEALVICGDGTDKDLLDAEGLAYTGAMIALTDMDEENLIISMYAAYRGVQRVITKINRLEYASVIRQAGIDRVISPKYIAANEIVR